MIPGLTLQCRFKSKKEKKSGSSTFSSKIVKKSWNILVLTRPQHKLCFRRRKNVGGCGGGDGGGGLLQDAIWPSW